MRFLLPLTVAALLLAAAPAQARPRLCDDRPGTTVAATPDVRAFLDTSGTGRDPVLRGCRHGSRTVVRLGVDSDCQEDGSVGNVTAAGRYVAFARTTCDTVSGDTTVLLFDLKAGRNVLATGAYSGEQSAALSSTDVAEIAVSPLGALAWVGHYTDGMSVRRSELHLRRPGGGAPEVLATSEAYDITDVALTARRLYWLQGVEARSLALA